MEYFFSKFFDTLFLLSGQLLPLRGRGYPPFLPRKNGKNIPLRGGSGPQISLGKISAKNRFCDPKMLILALFGQFYCGSFQWFSIRGGGGSQIPQMFGNDGIYGSQRRKGHSTSFKDFFFVTFNWDQGHHSQLLRCWTFIISDQIRYKWADIFQWYFQKRPYATHRVDVCSLPSQMPLSGHWLV